MIKSRAFGAIWSCGPIRQMAVHNTAATAVWPSMLLGRLSKSSRTRASPWRPTFEAALLAAALNSIAWEIVLFWAMMVLKPRIAFVRKREAPSL